MVDRITIIKLVAVLNACTRYSRIFPCWYTTDQGHVFQKGRIIFPPLRDLYGDSNSHKSLLGNHKMRNNKGKLPNFTAPDYNNSDQKL